VLDTDIEWQTIAFELDKGRHALVEWDVVYEAASYEYDRSTPQLTSWSLTGLRRYTNCQPVGDFKTQGRLSVEISTAGSDHTVTIKMGDISVASGSRTGDGSVTLAEANDSGISGTVSLAYVADLEAGESFLNVRWASQYKIYVDDELDSTVNDKVLANQLRAKIGPLSVDSHEVKIKAVSDSGVDGTLSGAASVSISGRPEPPGDPSYASGDYTDTVIEFDASATEGATYRAYDSELDEPVNLDDIAATADAGQGTIQITLPSLGAPAAGTRRVVIAAVDGGIEDGVRASLEIEYDASGAVIAGRPNIPGFAVSSISGRTLTARYAYNAIEEKATGHTAQLFLVPAGGSIDLGSPDAESALVSSGRIREGTISATADSDGQYFFCVVVRTAGGVQSANSALSGPVELKNSVLAAPANIAANVIG